MLIELIGKGYSCEAFLAEHIKLKSPRVVKRISKSHNMYNFFLEEASLLKSLKHPGIPIIYDLEEDEEYLYIIEEYIKGESLKAFVLNRQGISLKKAISFGIQICEIIEYLHNLKPFPILHLDLKPDNIIVCRNSIKIIDFGSAIFMKNKERVRYSFGTENYAAPEQMSTLILDNKTDIYSIGTILYFMLSGKNPETGNEKKENILSLENVLLGLKTIICKCVEKNPDNRYENVTELKNELKEFVYEKDFLLITVAGTQNRSGVTSVAMSLTSYFNQIGKNAIYKEEKNNILQYLKCNNAYVENNGIVKIKNFAGLPNYGNTVEVDYKNYKIVVLDCGDINRSDDFYDGDIKIVVSGIREWEMDNLLQWNNNLKDLEIKWIFNLCEKRMAGNVIKRIQQKNAYIMPLIESPYICDEKLKRLFEKMISEDELNKGSEEIDIPKNKRKKSSIGNNRSIWKLKRYRWDTFKYYAGKLPYSKKWEKGGVG